MIHHRHTGFVAILVSALFALSFLAEVSAQQTSPSSRPSAGGDRTKIILTSLSAPPGDEVAQKLASTITGSLSLVMKLSGDISVRRADFLAPTLAFDRARSYYREVNASGAVYGSVSPASNGAYQIELGVWNGSKPDTAPRLFRRTITNVLSSFTISDRLALDVASSIVGRPLAEGTLHVEKTKLLPSYAVYADGHLLARNRASVRVLTGRRVIVIAKPGGPLGDVPVELFHVTIRRDRTTTVRLSAREIASGAAAGTKLSERSASAGLGGAGSASRSATTPAAGLPASARKGATAGTKAAAASKGTGGGMALIRARASGRFFLDGRRDGTVTEGESRLLTGLEPGTHRFEVRYGDGHQVSKTELFSPETLSLSLIFAYRPMSYAKARLFHASTLSFAGRRFRLRSPNDYSSALSALSSLPATTPGMQSEIARAEGLVASWRPKRFFHFLWLGTFAAGAGLAGYTGITHSSAGSTVPLIEAGVILTSAMFLVVNAEHRGAVRGALTADLRSITDSYNRRMGGTPVGLVVVGAKSSGELFVDGSDRGSIPSGKSKRLYDLSLGRHVFLVLYSDGHRERETLTLTRTSRSRSLYFGYINRG